MKAAMSMVCSTVTRTTTNSKQFCTGRLHWMSSCYCCCWIATAVTLISRSSSFPPKSEFLSFRRSFVHHPSTTKSFVPATTILRGGGHNLLLASSNHPASSSNNRSNLGQKQKNSFISKIASTTSTIGTEDVAAMEESITTAAMISDAARKLSALRTLMKERDLDIYLVPTDDPHLSEYVPDAYKRRAYLSEFHGSAGTAVVTADEALLWTDSRYWNEASIQLDATLWTLQKSGLPETLTISKWLASIATEHYQQHKKPIRIGMDPFVHPASFAKEVDDAMSDSVKNENFEESPGSLIIEAENLVDIIWDSDGIRPPLPTSPFRVHPAEYAGKTVIEKVELIRTAMSKKKATAVVLCTLDDVAYVLNVRAKGDIDTCPVGIAYCVITEQTIDLYCDAIKVQNIQDHLIESGIRVRPYDQIVSDVEQHCLLDSSNKVWIDKARSNYALVGVISPKQCVDSQNPVTPMKAVKNNSELAGMREAHIVDGVAMAKFMSWLENEINTKQRSVSEVEIDDVLTKYRSEQDGFLECSFPTIAGVGSNGAIIHYRAKADSQLMKYLNKDAPILIDSGGQYVYGTTDVTRTWSFQDTPDPTFIDYYTRVLKGNIALDSMKFPENTPGLALDILARKFLWEISMDYGHGTGHGVGAALNVHEGPHSISPRWSNTEVLKAGMIVSNEPGYYEDGNFGLRIENLLEILHVNPEHNDSPDNGENDDNKGETKQPKGNQKKFLKFAKLTMIPIQKNLINVQLMTEEELDWLDSYHAEVWENVGSRLQDGSPEKIWLQEACSKIDRFV